LVSITKLDPEDLAVIERAGRRCAICHTGRHWRRFEVARPEGSDPVVLCGACRTRFAEQPPTRVARQPPSVQTTEKATSESGHESASMPRPAQREDKLLRALRALPAGEYSTERIAKAAGLNSAKVIVRLNALKEAGEVQQVGKHWSTMRPPSDMEAAFDRLQASTGNLRIVRERERVS
jgi:hypothetical protein